MKKRRLIILLMNLLMVLSMFSVTWAAEDIDGDKARAAQAAFDSACFETFGSFSVSPDKTAEITWPDYFVANPILKINGRFMCVIYVTSCSDVKAVKKNIRTLVSSEDYKYIIVKRLDDQVYNYNSLHRIASEIKERLEQYTSNSENILYEVRALVLPRVDDNSNIIQVGVHVLMPNNYSSESIKYFEEKIIKHPAVFYSNVVTMPKLND